MNTRSNTLRSLAPAALILSGLGLGLVVSPMLTSRPALAEPAPKGDPTSEPPFNANADRKMLISQFTELNSRLTRIEAKLNSGISVKVTEMPATKDSSK